MLTGHQLVSKPRTHAKPQPHPHTVHLVSLPVSLISRGTHAHAVLGALGVNAACIGGHDFDCKSTHWRSTTSLQHLAHTKLLHCMIRDTSGGLEALRRHISHCSFPTIVSNLRVATPSGPSLHIGNTARVLAWRCQGAGGEPVTKRLGLVGFVEEEWVTALTSVPASHVCSSQRSSLAAPHA